VRLLNVNSYHYRRGGSDAVYLDHAALFESRGHDIAYFSMRHPMNLASPWDRFFVEELEFGGDYSLLEKLRMASKVVYSFESQRKLGALLDTFEADIAHLHCIYHHLSPSILPTLKQRGVRTVMTAHDLKLACPAYKMMNAEGICEKCRTGSVVNVVKNRCIKGSLAASAIVAVESGLQRYMDTYRRHLDAVVAPSRFFKAKLCEWGWPEEKIHYVPNFVDPGAVPNKSASGPYFLYFGRLAPEKGVSTLIQAAARAGSTLVLAGTGPEEERLRGVADKLNADVTFVGFVAGDPLRKLVRDARAVVLPSEWYENAPMSLLEAFSQQTPCIGARIGGIPELIEEDVNGMTFRSADVDELTESLARFASFSETRRHEMGLAARQMVVERFSRDRYIDGMTTVYRTLGVDLL
jgi:glycosyltransferase involved in cell wall biosynthesis